MKQMTRSTPARTLTACLSAARSLLGTLCLWLLVLNAPSAAAQDYTFGTLAGLAQQSGSTDATGSAARFFLPCGVAVDSAGNVYVADLLNHTIRRVTPGGVVTTLAGIPGSPGSNGGPGSSARFKNPFGVAVDSAGNVYVGDTGNHTIRKVTSGGVVTTLAGLANTPGTNDGMGSIARFKNPSGVAVDSVGNVYVADHDNCTIRKVTPGGVVTTLAGLAGNNGSSDGPGSAARFEYPHGVAVDSVGNVYVADTDNHTIRQVTPGGVVTTLAGYAGSFGSNDGTNSAARFKNPRGVAVDSVGNVYVADTYNQTIRQVTPGGVVTTIGGLAANHGSSDGTGSAARFYEPRGVAVDSAGKVYVGDSINRTIRGTDLPPVITSAGTAPGHVGQAFSYQITAINSPTDFNATGLPAGLSINLTTGLISGTPTVAGPSTVALSASNLNGTGVRALLITTAPLTPPVITSASTAAGMVGYAFSYQITASNSPTSFNANGLPVGLSIDPTTGLIAGTPTVAGTAGVSLSASNMDGTGFDALLITTAAAPVVPPVITSASNAAGTVGYSFSYQLTASNSPTGFNATGLPAGLAIDPATGLISGTPIVAGPTSASLSAANAVGTGVAPLLITVSTDYTFTTLAGLAGSMDMINATGSAARFQVPTGVAVDSGGNVYVADTFNNTIRKVTPGGGVTTLAGQNSLYNSGSSDGTGVNAQFKFPFGVAVDSAGNVYVADTGNHTIRKVTSAGVVTTLAGLAGSFGGSNDGMGSGARFKRPNGVAVDSAGNVYVADTDNHTIRMVTPAGMVTTLAGLAGSLGTNDGPGSAARFNKPYGVAVDSAGNLYVADSGNYTIRMVTPGGVVTTLAGLAGSLGGTDATGSGARFNYPLGVAVDSAGNVYLTDGSKRIRKVTPGGGVTTIGGLAYIAGTNDGTGSAARFHSPHGVGVDSAGNVYVADNHTIRRTGLLPVITSASTATGMVGQAFSYQITAINLPTSFNAIGLPAGLAINPTTGLIAGTPTVAGLSTVTLSASNAGGPGVATLLITIAAAIPPVITSGSSAGGTVGYTFSYQLTASNSPTSFNAIGLPGGLSIDPTTGLISGTPTVVGSTSTVTLSASNAGGTGVATLLITVGGPYTFTTLAGLPGSPGSMGGLGSNARLNFPAGVAVDSAGNVYVGDYGTHTIRKVTPGGMVTTLAGQSYSDGSTDDMGSAARFFYPRGVAVDSAGNVYVGDSGNHTIRKVRSDGTVSTLAGLAGFIGSTNATSSNARFKNPYGVAADSAGNVYVGEFFGNHTIRKVTPGGLVTTLAGKAPFFGSNDGTGSTARFRDPFGVAVDSAGNVYVADYGNHTIRKVTSVGVVTTLAGLALNPGNTDGTGSGARFNNPSGVAADSAGNVYVADSGNHTIRKVTPGGVVTTIGGLAGSFGSNDGTGSAAGFYAPGGIAVDGHGNVYVADTVNHTIRKGVPYVAAIPPVITSASTAAGTVGQAFTYQITANNLPTSFNATGLPAGLAVNPTTGLIAGTPTVAGTTSTVTLSASNAGGTGVGTLLITVSLPVTLQDYTFTTLAGLAGSAGNIDDMGSAARFNYPQGVAVDSAGNVYVADEQNHTIRKVTPGGMVTTLAGLAGSIGSKDGMEHARFNTPSGVAVDSAGNVYVADSGNHTIRMVTPGGVVTTLAGQAVDDGSTDGTGSIARFRFPRGVAVDTNGNVYVADSENHTIRMVTPVGVVTTLAGLAGSNGSTDGTGSVARFNYPQSVAVDSAGNVYVADSGNSTIRMVTPGGVMAPGGVVTTLAGQAGSLGSNDGPGSAARFFYAFGVAVDSAGDVYVGDYANHTIRKVRASGVVTTIGGLAGIFDSSDGMGSAARFYVPHGVAVDSSGNVYVADTFNHTIRKGVPTAAVSPPVITSASTAVGMVGQAFTYQITANNRPTSFNATGLPRGLSINPTTGLIAGTPIVAGTTSVSLSASNAGGTGVGTLLITVSLPVTAQNYTFTTLAGWALNTGSTDATGSGARFNYPHGVAADDAGNVYVADTFNHTIRKVTPGGTVTTLAGLTGVSGSTDGPGSAARFNNPRGVAVDSAGSVYVADSGNHTIRKVTSAGLVSTLAGLALSSGNTDGTGSAARFYSLEGVAVDGVGNVYVGDTFNHTIRMVTSAGVVTTLAGLAGSNGNTDGTGNAARFDFPYGVAVDSASNVYVADSGNNTIRKVTPGQVMAPGWVVTTLAGLAGTPGSSDGTGSAARFDHLYGVAVDNAGSVYVTDADNNTIRKVTSVGVVTTLGGLAGVSGSADGTGSAARFNYPRGMAVDSAGNVYVGDTFNHTIRKGVPTAAVSPPVITSSPVDQIAEVGGTVSFSVVTAGTAPLACQWWFNDVPISGATNKTYTMMNVQANQAGSYRVVVSNEAGSLTSAPAVLKVNLMNQTITFGSLANKATTDPAFGVNATANSQLPVSFSIVSGPARIIGSTITLSGAVGTVVVRAEQAGSANYNAATPVNQSFSVGGMPVMRGEVFADLAGGFQRNKDFHLTLRVRPSNNVQNYSVEEIVPLGWTVKPGSISHGGTFDSTSRKLKWGPFFDTVERACACVLEPGNNTAPAVFAGGVLFDGMFDSATGLQISGVFVPFSERRTVPRGAFLPENANVGRNVRTEGFRVVVLGEAGKRYDIEASATPTIPGSWVPVAVNLDGSALLDFTDSLATSSPRRFYRVIER